jgi:hypothetical protein
MLMSNVRAIFLFALAWGAAFETSAAQTAAAKAGDPLPAEPRIGVAASKSDQVCVAMPGSPLAPGTIVTLINPTRPQSVKVVTIDGVAECAALAGALISGPYYSVPPFDSEPTVWIAVPGQPATRRISPGVVAVMLSAQQIEAQFRVCTSTEGVHLTVWSGDPLQSRRLWHQYFYLGYDVEPSCKDGDGGRRELPQEGLEVSRHSFLKHNQTIRSAP